MLSNFQSPEKQKKKNKNNAGFCEVGYVQNVLFILSSPACKLENAEKRLKSCCK